MRNCPNLKVEAQRAAGPKETNSGAFFFLWRGTPLKVIASNGGGWDHVSVSCQNRCPTWAEMDYVKNLFFKDDEVVIQLHVAKSDHINYHPYCLHLWRPQTNEELAAIRAEWGEEWPPEYPVNSPGAIPLPPKEFVGPVPTNA